MASLVCDCVNLELLKLRPIEPVTAAFHFSSNLLPSRRHVSVLSKCSDDLCDGCFFSIVCSRQRLSKEGVGEGQRERERASLVPSGLSFLTNRQSAAA